MALIIQKGKKFFQGHGYGTGVGYNFSWTEHLHLARRFCDGEISIASGFARQTHGKLLAVPNSRKELRKKARQLLLYPTSPIYTGPYGSISAPVPVCMDGR